MLFSLSKLCPCHAQNYSWYLSMNRDWPAEVFLWKWVVSIEELNPRKPIYRYRTQSKVWLIFTWSTVHFFSQIGLIMSSLRYMVQSSYGILELRSGFFFFKSSSFMIGCVSQCSILTCFSSLVRGMDCLSHFSVSLYFHLRLSALRLLYVCKRELLSYRLKYHYFEEEWKHLYHLS